MPLVDSEKLVAFVADIFAAIGCSREEAARIGRYLVNANLTGHDSHGVARVPRYVAWKRDGLLIADQTVKRVVDTPVLAVLEQQAVLGGEQAEDLIVVILGGQLLGGVRLAAEQLGFGLLAGLVAAVVALLGLQPAHLLVELVADHRHQQFDEVLGRLDLVLPAGDADEEAPHDRLADVHGIEEAPHPGVDARGVRGSQRCPTPVTSSCGRIRRLLRHVRSLFASEHPAGTPRWCH